MFYYFFAIVILFSFNTNAQENSGIKSFAETSPVSALEDPILDGIVDEVGSAAIKNITDAEKVFCYKVEKMPDNYDGYTLNGLEITGFCGVLNEKLQKRIVKEFLRSPQNVLLDTVDNCNIQPQAMLRFVRGVDATDVLISAPCYSYVVFYGGRVKAFNARPMTNFINSLTKAFDKKKSDFISPALLGQTIPVGIIREQLEQGSNPLDSSVDITAEENTPAQASGKNKPSSGWNSLNF